MEVDAEGMQPLKGDIGDLRAVSVISQVSLDQEMNNAIHSDGGRGRTDAASPTAVVIQDQQRYMQVQEDNGVGPPAMSGGLPTQLLVQRPDSEVTDKQKKKARMLGNNKASPTS